MPERERRASRGRAEAGAPASAQPIRVLLVEDNPGDARLILEMLRDVQANAFDLEQVDRLEPALERLSHAAVDVVLLDLGLPDSEGMATFHRAHAGAAEQPIIVISGLDDETLALEAVRCGAQDYLVKGRIEGHLLARVIRYAIERQRTEVQLRWLTLAVDQSPASIFITDPRGTIQYVNRKFTEITGYSATEAIGQTPRMLKSGLTPPEYYRALWSTILAGSTWHAEIQNRRKSGQLYWDEVTISPIRDARGAIMRFLAVQQDITDRKRTEQALRERDERFQQLADNINEVFFIQDIQYRETLYISPAYEKIWGRTCQSLYDDPRSFLDPVPPEDQARLIASIARNQQGEDAGDVEFRVVRPDGDVRWMLAHAVPVRNAQGEVYRIAGVALDITERKRAEDALAGSLARLRALMDNAKDGISLISPEGVLVDVNPRILEMLGRERADVVGHHIQEFSPPDTAGGKVTAFGQAVAQGGGEVLDVPLRRPDGQETLVDFSVSVFAIASERLVLAIGRDVTEQRSLERQLRQAQKMEAVGRLAGGVAHDFNNVLTAIFGYADLVMEDLPPNSQSRKDLEEVRKAAQRASALTRQLLAFSRQQVLAPAVLSLNDLVEDIDKMLRRTIGEDVELRSSLARDLGNVRADPGQVQQVLMNLVVNARDAMPVGGKVLIETANADLTETYAERHQPVIPGQYVMLAVSDTGIGMSPAITAKIFEPFFTTKEKGKGTGLGLSTVYGIVKQSNGYVWVYSEPGRGTTFKIYLPRVDAPADAHAPAREAGTLAGSETILLAEDDESLRRLAKGLLERLGYTVLEAENAAQALALAGTRAGPIHLLVSDVVMPGASGRELARRLAETRAETKVLYMSGYTDDAIVHHGMLEPGLNFLQKPFTPAVLARKVRDVLDAT
jgi:two-component system cell cycle sensor histidine kinase/response regulator CckA